MMHLITFKGIYLYRDKVDFRKSINGLAHIVESEMRLSVFEPFLFIFVNRDRSRIKILYWDRTGFALWMKRLEEARFPWVGDKPSDVVEISAEDLRLLLRGFDIWKIKSHQTLKYDCVGT